MSSAVSALSTFYQDSLNPFDAQHVEISTIRLLAKLPTIAAYAYKKSVGQPNLYPDNSLGLVENFLRLTFGFPAERQGIGAPLEPGSTWSIAFAVWIGEQANRGGRKHYANWMPLRLAAAL